MSYYEYIKRRIRHSSMTRLLLEILAKVGFNLRPFVLFRESDSGKIVLDPGPDYGNVEMRYLDRDEIHFLTPFSRHPGRNVPESTLYERLEAGNRCIALFLDGDYRSPELQGLLGQLTSDYQWFAPGRFLWQEHVDALSSQPQRGL